MKRPFRGNAWVKRLVTIQCREADSKSGNKKANYKFDAIDVINPTQPKVELEGFQPILLIYRYAEVTNLGLH